MATTRQVRQLGELARELDMMVFQLERDTPGDERPRLQQMRRELERLRDALNDVVRELE